MDRGKTSEDLIREARQWSETPGQPGPSETPAPSPRPTTPPMSPPDPFPAAVPPPPAFQPVPAPPTAERSGGNRLWFAVVVALAGVALAAAFGLRGGGDDHVDIFAVAPGTCFLDPASGTVARVEVVDCTASHDLEAFAVVTLPYSDDAAIPPREELFDTAYEQCLPFFTPYTGEPYETSPWYLDAFVPDHRGWKLGDREALCVLFLATADGTLLPATESAKA